MQEHRANRALPGIARCDQKTLFAPGHADQLGIMQASRGGDDLAAQQSIDAAHGAFVERRQRGAGLAHWLPPTIGGGSAGLMPGGRASPDRTQTSSAWRGKSHLPVTLLQGIAPAATSL